MSLCLVKKKFLNLNDLNLVKKNIIFLKPKKQNHSPNKLHKQKQNPRPPTTCTTAPLGCVTQAQYHRAG